MGGTQEAARAPDGTWNACGGQISENFTLPLKRNAKSSTKYNFYNEDLKVASILTEYLQQLMLAGSTMGARHMARPLGNAVRTPSV